MPDQAPIEPPIEVTFDRLLEVLSQAPDDLGEAQRLAGMLADHVAEVGFRLEGGIEQAGMAHEMTLRGRMLSRGIDYIELKPGAEWDELVAAARALASDTADLVSGPGVVLQAAPPDQSIPGMVSPYEPVESQQFRFLEEEPADQRHRSSDPLSQEMSRLSRAIKEAAARRSWTEVVHASEILVGLSGRVKQDSRRSVTLLVRQVITPDLVRPLIDHAVQAPEDRARTGKILRHLGPSAAEVVMDALAESGVVEPMRFLIEAVVEMPQVAPMAVGLLRSDKAREMVMGAELVGLMKEPQAVGPLLRLVDHPEAPVRRAAYQALHFAGPRAGQALRDGLVDPDPEARATAATGLLSLEGNSAVTLIEQAIAEAPTPMRLPLIAALGQAAVPEAPRALGRIASRGRLFPGTAGFDRKTRLAAVRALAESPTKARTLALRLVAERSRGAVSRAARAALSDLD